jgi:DNA-binding SARP family transcriptional activator
MVLTSGTSTGPGAGPWRAVRFRILGPLEIEGLCGRVELRRKKQKALLVALLLRGGEVVSSDQLIEDLWGESPPRHALASLQNLVSELRKRLGPALLRTRAPGYMLELDPHLVDAHRFVRLVDSARAAERAAERAEALRRALALWRGRALVDVAFEPFADQAAARLEATRQDAREELIDAELQLGRHHAVVAEIESLIAEQPFRERPRSQLMLALYRAGRQADALAAFREARRFLHEELGLEPSPTLRSLHQAILRQEPALDLLAMGGRALVVV